MKVESLWTWQEHCRLREEDGTSRISEYEGYIRIVTFIFGNSRKPRKGHLFCGLKNIFFVVFFLFSSPAFRLAGEICQKTHSIWSIWAPRAPFVIYTPHIWSHHPVLDFHTQITRKYSTAMCSMCSCSDQRSQNNLLWSMKWVESLRMQSFKGFWKSWKIPGLNFWESRDPAGACL